MRTHDMVGVLTPLLVLLFMIGVLVSLCPVIAAEPAPPFPQAIAVPDEPDCANPRGESERVLCRLGDVRTLDALLNRIYRARMASMEAVGQARLRAEQRAWLRQRNTTCGLEATRADWLEAVARDAQRAACVIRATQERQRAIQWDRRHEYDLAQMVRETDDDVLFSVKIHPNLPRTLIRVAWKGSSAESMTCREGKAVHRIEISQEGNPRSRRTLNNPFDPIQPICYVAGMLRADDVNFDGYLDVGLLISEGATGNETWGYWLYDPRAGRFTARKDLALANPSFDAKTKTIHTGMKCGWHCVEYAIYAWRDGRPVLIDQGVQQDEEKSE